MNAFGKYCRKLRIDRGELMKDMAKKIGVSAAYLSAVEVGRRKIPKEWLEKIGREYCLNVEQRAELKKAYDESKTEVKINIGDLSEDDRSLAVAFARKFASLDSKTKEEILFALHRRDN